MKKLPFTAYILAAIAGVVFWAWVPTSRGWADATPSVTAAFDKLQIRFRRQGAGGTPSRITLLGQSRVDDARSLIASMATGGVSVQTGLSSSPAEGLPCASSLSSSFPASTCRVLLDGQAVECRVDGSLVRARISSADASLVRVDARLRVGDFASSDKFSCGWNPGTAGVEATAQVSSATTLRTATASTCKYASAGAGAAESVRCRWRSGEGPGAKSLTSLLVRLPHPTGAVVRSAAVHPDATIDQFVSNDVGDRAMIVATAPPEKIGGTIATGPLACVEFDASATLPTPESVGCEVVDAEREGVPVTGVICTFEKGCDESRPEQWRVSVDLPR